MLHAHLHALALLATVATPALAQGGGGGGGGGPPPPPPELIGNFPTVAVPIGNPQTPEKILLGMALFFEEQLSSDDTVACATCHLPEAGGGDPRAGARAPGRDGVLGTLDDEFGSPGVPSFDAAGNYVDDPLFGLDLRVTDRNSPSVIASAFFNTQFWDSRAGSVFRDESGHVVLRSAASLEVQAVEPPLSATEMSHPGRTWADITAKLARVRPLQLATDLPARLAQFLGTHRTYGPLFALVFGTPEITRERVAMAIASYERTLVPDQAPFDLGTMTPRQQLGFQAYQQRGTCETCHPSTNRLFSFGSLQEVAIDTHPRSVKIPSLRNVGLRRRFMSGGVFASVDEVVRHYTHIGAFVPAPSGGDHEALVDFLANALTDPRVAQKLPPFDRPTLRSEREPPGANLFGPATAGTGGIEPAMLGDSPPFLGNPNFQIGLGHAPVRTKAVLFVAPQRAAQGTLVAGVPVSVDPAQAFLYVALTSRTTHGHALATQRIPLPKSATLLGQSFYAQWLVRDGGALTGYSATRAASFVLFAR